MAYRVLSDPARRARYDSAQVTVAVRPPSPSPVSPVAPRTPSPAPLPRRRGGCTSPGVVLVGRWGVPSRSIVLGLAAGVWVVSLQRHDADAPATAASPWSRPSSRSDGERRFEFTTRDGRTILAVEEIKSGEEQAPIGARVPIHYDRNDPSSIVTDTSHTGRDITLWIVAVKLFVGGIVLLVVGARRLRRE